MWLRRKYHRINDSCTVGNNFNQNSVWKVFSVHQTARTVIKLFPLPQYSESGSKNCHVERKRCNYTVLGKNSKSCQIYSHSFSVLPSGEKMAQKGMRLNPGLWANFLILLPFISFIFKSQYTPNTKYVLHLMNFCLIE